MMNLYDYTYRLVQQIPDGKVSTYKGVAYALGDPIAARAVGYMMNQNPDPDNTPCYKIVNSDGSIGGYSTGVDEKIKRLRGDGIKVKDGFIVDFKEVYFSDFKTDQPLKKLREEQVKLSRSVILTDDHDDIDTVAGVDAAYPYNAFDEACVSMVIMDYKRKRIIDEYVGYSKTLFPYIPTYLAYREIPLVESLVKNIPFKPSVILVDSNGVLHPRLCGLASHLGILIDTPTIGVAKKPQIGVVNNDKTIIYNNMVRGLLHYPHCSCKPLYISPGHRVSLETSLQVVDATTMNHRLPEVLHRAHVLAKKNLSERF